MSRWVWILTCLLDRSTPHSRINIISLTLHINYYRVVYGSRQTPSASFNLALSKPRLTSWTRPGEGALLINTCRSMLLIGFAR